MATELDDLSSFVAVVRAGGFRDAARSTGGSASGLSEAVRRLETRLGVRLLNRTTRSVAATEAGARLAERLVPALGEVEAALDVVNAFRDRPAGTLRLNVPAHVARIMLPPIIAPFLRAYPDIRLRPPISTRAAVRSIRATCSITRVCAGGFRAGRCRHGNSSAMAKWCGSTLRAR